MCYLAKLVTTGEKVDPLTFLSARQFTVHRLPVLVLVPGTVDVLAGYGCVSDHVSYYEYCRRTFTTWYSTLNTRVLFTNPVCIQCTRTVCSCTRTCMCHSMNTSTMNLLVWSTTSTTIVQDTYSIQYSQYNLKRFAAFRQLMHTRRTYCILVLNQEHCKIASCKLQSTKTPE